MGADGHEAEGCGTVALLLEHSFEIGEISGSSTLHISFGGEPKPEIGKEKLFLGAPYLWLQGFKGLMHTQGYENYKYTPIPIYAYI